MKNPLKKWPLPILAPLALGALAYWATRSQTPPAFLRWLALPPCPVDGSAWLPAWLTASLPSFCWVFSMTFALMYIWQFEKTGQKALLGSTAFGVSVLFETLQAVGVFAGTFDWGDVAASGLGAWLAVFIFIKINP